jgi:polysaccharide export outer membrane protein
MDQRQRTLSNNVRRSSHRLGSLCAVMAAALLVLISIAGARLEAQVFNNANGQGTQTLPNPYTVTAPGVVGQTPGAPGMNTPNSLGMPNVPGAQPGQSGAGMGGAAFYPDPKEYTLSAGELINVRLFSAPDYYSVVRISKDGTAELPLIGSLKLSDLTIVNAELTVAGRLKSEGLYQNPEIIITLAEAPSQSQDAVTLTGELHAVIPLMAKQRSLIDVLASQGGLPPTASHVISIVRPGTDQPIVVDLGNTPEEMKRGNISVYPHDTIFVGRTGVVYVLGSFRSTGAVPLQNGPMTLLQVAAISGGPVFDAKYDDLRIIRTTGTQRSEVKVDIKRVLYGTAPDPILQAGDIIFLPNALFKTAISAGGIGTLFGILSLLLIAVR